jgi:hypothetical protein
VQIDEVMEVGQILAMPVRMRLSVRRRMLAKAGSVSCAVPLSFAPVLVADAWDERYEQEGVMSIFTNSRVNNLACRVILAQSLPRFAAMQQSGSRLALRTVRCEPGRSIQN